MPRVLRILNRFNLGGPTYNAAYLTKYLSDDYETDLIGGYHDQGELSSSHILEDLDVPFTYVPEMYRPVNWKKDRVAYAWIKARIEKFRPDIVHTHAAKAGALGRLAAHNAGVKAIVHTFHGHVFNGYFSRPKTEFYKRVERHLARKSHAIVAISPEQHHDLVNEFRICSNEQTHIIRLGFDLRRFQQNIPSKRQDFRARYGLGEETLVVGIIGRLTAIKNHTLFLQMMKALRQQNDRPVVGLVVGGGELEQDLKEWVDANNFSFEPETQSGILFAGWHKDVDCVVAACDIVALTSHNEGTPVSLIEAQAGGKPVVSTNVGGVADVVSDGKSGIIAEANNVESLCYAVQKLIDNPDRMREMGAQGVLQSRRYSYTRLANDMENLYRTLL